MMEKELFSNYSIDEKKLREYGFRADGGTLIYTQDLPQEHLRIIITCDSSLTGKIMDLDFGGEYVNFRMDTSAGYSAGIRQNEAYPVTRMKPDSEGRPVTLNTTQDPKPVSAGDL